MSQNDFIGYHMDVILKSHVADEIYVSFFYFLAFLKKVKKFVEE